MEQRSAILTTVGVLEQPLGSARLHVARLVASLLQTCDLSICQEICRPQHHGPAVGKSLSCTHRISQTRHYELAVGGWSCFFIIFSLLTSSLHLSLVQDLFFKYTWNNFLHLQVELCVASILNHSAHVDLQNQVCRTTRRDQLQAQAAKRRREHLARTAPQTQQTRPFKMLLLPM